MITHACHGPYKSFEWRELGHADHEAMADFGTRLLEAAPNLSAVQWPYALVEHLARPLARQRGGPVAAQLRRLRRAVINAPDDARQLQARLRAAPVEAA